LYGKTISSLAEQFQEVKVLRGEVGRCANQVADHDQREQLKAEPNV